MTHMCVNEAADVMFGTLVDCLLMDLRVMVWSEPEYLGQGFCSD